MSAVCKVGGCGKPVWAIGYCRLHYDRYRRHKDPHKVAVSRGEKHPKAKLTEADVRTIRKMKGKTLEEIGGMYGVQKMCISRIVNRKSWKHVP